MLRVLFLKGDKFRLENNNREKGKVQFSKCFLQFLTAASGDKKNWIQIDVKFLFSVNEYITFNNHFQRPDASQSFKNFTFNFGKTESLLRPLTHLMSGQKHQNRSLLVWLQFRTLALISYFGLQWVGRKEAINRRQSQKFESWTLPPGTKIIFIHICIYICICICLKLWSRMSYLLSLNCL